MNPIKRIKKNFNRKNFKVIFGDRIPQPEDFYRPIMRSLRDLYVINPLITRKELLNRVKNVYCELEDWYPDTPSGDNIVDHMFDISLYRIKKAGYLYPLSRGVYTLTDEMFDGLDVAVI